MPDYGRSLFLQCLDDWKRFPDQFLGLTAAEQAAFLKQQGFASLHDLLAHVAAWWEEANGIIRDRVSGIPRPSRKYDLDAFNGESLARLQDIPEPDLLGWYESRRQQIAATVAALGEDWFQVRTVYGWLDGVLLEHLKEHGLDAPRFLLIDALQREWRGYAARFDALSPDDQHLFLEKQGFARFRDVVAHVIAWWETGIRMIGAGGEEDPCEAEDVDAFNAAAIQRFDRLEVAQVYEAYERTRLVLLNLVGTIPDDILSKPTAQGWLRADVIDHYYEHRL